MSPRSPHSIAQQRLAKALANRAAARRALTDLDVAVADAMLAASEQGVKQREIADLAREHDWTISQARVSQLVVDAWQRRERQNDPA